MKVELKSKSCTGCGLCSIVCKKHAIEMQKDKFGFLRPLINNELCIGCGVCKRICEEKHEYNRIRYSYILRHNNTKIYSSSQSGGAFTLISDWILNQEGVVYGAALNETFELEHHRASEPKERDKMRGSVYIQSNAFEIFLNVVNDLKQGKSVLFVGTPCQVSALKKYIMTSNMDDTKLYTVDLLCHGVASSMLWKRFIDFYESRYKENIEYIQLCGCDEKKRPYFSFVMGNKKIPDKEFKKIYYSNLALRTSCYQCEFTDIKRMGDISIGDAAGIEKRNKEFYKPEGTSLVLINTDKGEKIFEKVKQNAEYRLVDIGNYMQECLIKSATSKRSIDEFWNDFNKKNMKYMIEKYARHNIFLNIKYVLKRVFRP